MMEQRAVAAIRCIRTERSIRRLQQRTEHMEYDLVLTENAVISYERDFPLAKVWDMSVRAVALRCWFLYLHTDEGVFAFQTEESPDVFINRYRNMKT